MKDRDHLGDLGIDGNIILEWVLWKQVGRCGMNAFVPGQAPVAGSCSNEFSGAIKRGISRLAE
jgi:hypothetical protein